jgi:YgiT-type zinc finger domain-containing protein
MLETQGSVRMTKKDGSLIIFKGVPLYQCRQCGEQYIPGKWAENIGEIMRNECAVVPDEIMSVPVIALHG